MSLSYTDIRPARQSDSHVPEGWEIARLPDVSYLNPRKPSADTLPADAPVTFVPMPAVDADSGTINKPELRPFAKVRGGFTSFREGDVIMAKITPCMENGKAAIARELKNGLGFGSSEFHVLRPAAGVLAEYLYHFVRQESFRRAAEAEMTGSVGQKRVPIGFLEVAELPLPPLAEQKRIVAKVEELLVQIDAARKRLAGVPGVLKRFRQAVLAAACSARLTEDWRDSQTGVERASEALARIVDVRASRNKQTARGLRAVLSAQTTDHETEDRSSYLPDSWAATTVEEIATVCLGGTPSRKDASLWGGNIPWVSSGEVGNCRIRATRECISPRGLEQSNAKRYPKGTVLIAMIGEGKTRGQAAILDIEACTNQNVAALVFDADNVCPDYIWLWALAQYEAHRSGGRGGNYPALNGQIVRQLQLPFPPLAEQREIVRRVDALFRLAEAIDKRVAAAMSRTDKLTQAILARAFRGELVPTEAELARREAREYEPASALLARIQEQRLETAGSKQLVGNRRSASARLRPRGPSHRPAS